LTNHDELCKSIFDIDPKIRYVVAYHESGEKFAGGMRDGIISLLPDKVTEESVRFSIIRLNTRKMLAQYIGKCKYAMAEYEKIRRIMIPLGDKEFLLVSMEIEVNHDMIIGQILKLCAELD